MDNNLTTQPIVETGRDRDFRILVEGVRDYAIFLLDTEGRVKSWNQGAFLITGYRFEEVRGEHFSCFYTEEDRAAGRPQQVLESALANGSYSEDSWRVRKNGTRFMANVVVDTLRDEAGRLIGFAKVVRDITERLQMQEAFDSVREETREQLFQARKLEAVGKLTGGIAHDFNNLLTVIRGSIELAERHAAGNPPLKRLLEAVQDAAGRAADLTHQLLAFSRRQPLRPELLDLAQQMLTVSAFLDRSLRGNIIVETDLPPDLWPVELDPRQFELALLNVGLNARDAMPRGGKLCISARNVTIHDPSLGLKGDFVRLKVCDTGVGIPPDLISKVVEPFFTTKDVGKGSGLGLSQAYGFAQQSGGALVIASKVGVGTEVIFFLPARIDALRRIVAASVTRHETPSRCGRLLVVEDDELVRGLAVEALESSGYAVVAVGCSLDALEALANQGPFDAVFSDIIMPGAMNGIELAVAIRREMPEMPILLTTGFSESAVHEDAHRFPLLTKPYRLFDLASRLAQLLDARPMKRTGDEPDGARSTL